MSHLDAFSGLPGSASSVDGPGSWPADLVAPSGPAEVAGPSVATTSRAQLPLATSISVEKATSEQGPIKPVAPVTLEDVLKKPGLAAGFAEFVEELGADSGTAVASFCCLSEDDMVGALNNTLLEEAPLSPIQRAELVKCVRDIFSGAGFDPPALGGVLPKAPVALPPAPLPPQPPQPAAQPASTAQENSNTDAGIPLCEIIDQAARGAAKPLSMVELALCRSRYEMATGCPP